MFPSSSPVPPFSSLGPCPSPPLLDYLHRWERRRNEAEEIQQRQAGRTTYSSSSLPPSSSGEFRQFEFISLRDEERGAGGGGEEEEAAGRTKEDLDWSIRLEPFNKEKEEKMEETLPFATPSVAPPASSSSSSSFDPMCVDSEEAERKSTIEAVQPVERDDEKINETTNVSSTSTYQMLVPMPIDFTSVVETPTRPSSWSLWPGHSTSNTIGPPSHHPPITNRNMTWNEMEWRFVQERVGRPKVQRLIRFYNPRWSYSFHELRQQFRSQSCTASQPDTQDYEDHLSPYEPTHPPTVRDTMWSFVPADGPSEDPNFFPKVMERGFTPIARTYGGFMTDGPPRVTIATIFTSQNIDRIIIRSHIPQWVWLCQVLAGTRICYFHQNAYHGADEHLEEFHSLIASENSPADARYDEIVLPNRQQVLPVWLIELRNE